MTLNKELSGFLGELIEIESRVKEKMREVCFKRET